MANMYIRDEAVKGALSALGEMGEATQPDEQDMVSAKEVIIEIHDDLQSYRDKGFTWEQISLALRDSDVLDLQGTTLETYFRETRKAARRRKAALIKATKEEEASTGSTRKRAVSCAPSAKSEVLDTEVVE